jgi:hypothetical protein
LNEENSFIKLDLADTARDRADLYSLLMKVLGNLPDDRLLKEVRTSAIMRSPDKLCSKFCALKPEVDNIRSFIFAPDNLPGAKIIGRLREDRIRIIKGLNGLDINLPGNKLHNKSETSSVLNVTCFPLEDKELPDESVSNVLDYLCIELDFMDYLCRQEHDQWINQANAIGAISQESDFLREHLNGWTSTFCPEAEKQASSIFYRGFLSILEHFIVADLGYLNGLLLSIR